EAIDRELKQRQQALKHAIDASKSGPGFLRLNYTSDFYSTLVERHLKGIWQVAGLLAMDSVWHCHYGNVIGAWDSGEGILKLAPSVTEPPLMITQIVRFNLQLLSIRCMERVLEEFPIDEEKLKLAQERLEQEGAQLLWFSGLRGERAGLLK